MNIKYEDCAEIINSEYEVIVPLLISDDNGELEIEAYTDIREYLELILAKYPSGLFSKQAIDLIDTLLEPWANSHGYYREIIGKYRWYEVFTLTDPLKANYDLVSYNTVALSSEHLALENLTSFDLKELLDKKLETYIVLDNGCVCAIASVNEHDRDQKMLELTVECSPSCRRRGYAASALAALSGYLLGQGYTVTYVTSRYNRPSIKLARKLSFERSGRFYAYTAFKD